jgi:hypothetical protein
VSQQPKPANERGGAHHGHEHVHHHAGGRRHTQVLEQPAADHAAEHAESQIADDPVIPTASRGHPAKPSGKEAAQ